MSFFDWLRKHQKPAAVEATKENDEELARHQQETDERERRLQDLQHEYDIMALQHTKKGRRDLSH